MDGQPANIVERAEDLAKRIVAEAEKLGHEALGEIERILHIRTSPSQPATVPAGTPVNTTAPASTQQS